MIKDIGIGKMSAGNKQWYFIPTKLGRWIVKKCALKCGFKVLNNLSQPLVIVNWKTKQLFSVHWSNLHLIENILEC